MRLVYYSLANAPDTQHEQQWIQSIRSLRRYNQTIPVCLFLFNGAHAGLLHEASRWGVAVQYLGDYEEYLRRAHVRGALLALYPTFHKFLALAHGPIQDATQILYVDCDTFFFDNVEILFGEYASCEWYAREEPMSRRNHYGYNPSHIDEAALEELARRERLRTIAPFNSGVCVLNHGIWNRMERLRIHYLDLAWRLLAGCELHGGGGMQHDPKIQTAVLNTLSDIDRDRALRYPSTNAWIIEQIALWLALGCLPQMSQGWLSRRHVAQGDEFRDLFPAGRRCVVAHYFSTLETEFFSAVPAIPA